MYRGNLLFLLVALSLFSTSSYAQINSAQGGLWSAPETWSPDPVPTAGDDVVINGHEVFLDQDANIKSLTITNSTDSNAKLDLNGTGVTLTIIGDLNVVHDSGWPVDADFYIRDQDSVYVGGMVHYNRLNTHSSSGSSNMKLAGDARLTVEGDYVYDYGQSALLEANLELQLQNTSIADIKGNLSMTTDDGAGIGTVIEGNSKLIIGQDAILKNIGGLLMLFNVKENAVIEVARHMTVDNAKTSGISTYNFVQVGDGGGILNIDGNLNLVSIKDEQRAKVTVNGATAELRVGGDINFNSIGDEDVLIDVEVGAAIYLGGNLNRAAGGYGELTMEADTRFVYNGSGSQTVSESTASAQDAGTDNFQFANVEFDNDSGMPLILEGTVIVEKQLVLTNGILQTSNLAPLVIAENAEISGGSESAYIDGPIRKEGAIVGDSFIFPVGDEGVYAPFEINVPKSATIEYTVQYLSCPPPLSGAIAANLTTVSGTGHWVYNRSATSPVADITLHWSDATDYGITDLADLRVAVYHPDSTAWSSLGNGGTVDNGDGSGSIINALSCPPPLSGSLYTFGSEKGLNPLPVVLSGFQAQAKGQVVEVTWETESEFNSDFFEIERSSDGVHFQPIKKVDALKNANQLTRYFEQDINPKKGINYYRLCQVDNLGMKVYSRVVPATFEAPEITSVFPNPVKDVLHIKGDFTAKVYDMQVYNATGKLMKQLSVMGEKGILKLNTNELNLPGAGIYFMRIDRNGEQQTIPFIKD